MSDKPCIDCKRIADEAGGKIPARKPALKPDGTPVPGNRCVTHEREKKKQRRESARANRWEKVYALAEWEYWAIHSEQNGVCFICERAKGVGQTRLVVDHCHESGLVRGLLCKKCNLDVLGFSRDDVDFFRRAIDYLERPPAIRALGAERYIPD